MVRSGGKVCWGIDPATIPHAAEIETFISPVQFIACQDPLNCASINKKYQSSGFSSYQIVYPKLIVAEASTIHGFKFSKYVANTLTIEAHGYQGILDLINPVSLSIGFRSFTAPAGNYNAATAYQTVTVLSTGIENDMVFLFNVVLAGNIAEIIVRRNIDDNPNSFYFTGLLCYGDKSIP